VVDWMVTGWSLEETRYLFFPHSPTVRLPAYSCRHTSVHTYILPCLSTVLLHTFGRPEQTLLVVVLEGILDNQIALVPALPTHTHTSRLLLRPSPTHSLPHGGALALYSKTLLILEGRSQGKACNNTCMGLAFTGAQYLSFVLRSL